MRAIFLTSAVLLLFSLPLFAQNLEQLRQTIETNVPKTLPENLERKVSPELVDACKNVIEAADKILTDPNTNDEYRRWTLQRKAVALIILAYADTPVYYLKLIAVSDELEQYEGLKKIFKETEKHVLKIGSALAVLTKINNDNSINLKSLAERMVIFAQQYPSPESEGIIEQFLLAVRKMSTIPRDRRLAIIAPIFQKHFQMINHTAKAKALESDIHRATLPGQPMFLAGVDLDGNDLDLETVKDKVVLLQFWGTWCPHCKEEIPALISLYEKYHGAGLEIVGINTAVKGDENAKKVKSFVSTTTFEGKKIPWKILHEGLSGQKNKRTITDYYGIDELPVLILIGRNGKVLKLHPLPSTLDSVIAEAVSPLATVEFTEEEKKQIEEIKKKKQEEIDQQIKTELSAP